MEFNSNDRSNICLGLTPTCPFPLWRHLTTNMLSSCNTVTLARMVIAIFTMTPWTSPSITSKIYGSDTLLTIWTCHSTQQSLLQTCWRRLHGIVLPSFKPEEIPYSVMKYHYHSSHKSHSQKCCFIFLPTNFSLPVSYIQSDCSEYHPESQLL